jgi:uncharacterized protein (DUF1778 family)
MGQKRQAIYVRCSEEEAEKIRKAARAERRTISGYILNAALGRIQAREKFLSDFLERDRQAQEKKKSVA